MRAIFGLDPHSEGEVYIDGKKVDIKSPADAISNKLVMLAEDRRQEGIIPIRSVRENASIANMKRFIYGGRTHKNVEKRDVSLYFRKMNVKTPTLETPIASLSGGNQQKVLLARWLLCEPDVMILDEPTRGIDVGAKYEIYELMTQIARDGKAIVMISSELPELLGMCDRIYVMNQGLITGCLNRDEFSQEIIMKYETGVMKQENV